MKSDHRDEAAPEPIAAAPSSTIDRKALSHAIRTPLNHIIGYGELALEEARERGLDGIAEDLVQILAAGRDLLTVVNVQLCNDIEAIALAPRERAENRITGISTNDQRHATAAPTGRLLVVDDNADNREIVGRLLVAVGYDVITAADGAQALAMLGKEHVDLVLLDVMMPVMDGIEACRRIKTQPATRLTPVVIMTSLGEVDDRVEGLLAGADDFLTKPVDRNELLARIHTSLSLRRTIEERFDQFRGQRDFLTRFVPHWVARGVDESFGPPEMEKSDRDLSAMFVDVSGYTRLSERMGRAADFIVEKYFSRFLDTIRSHNGDITETSGDGLMAVFPGDDPREHALASVRAALEIIRRTSELNRQLEGIFEPVSVHIGINSGFATIGPTRYEGVSGVRWIYTALGATINVAARIAEVAAGGTICIGEETGRRVENAFSLQDLGERTLKNVKNPVRVLQVLGEQSVTSL